MRPDEVVAEREEAHGPVQTQAFVSQEILEALRHSPAKWERLSPTQKQSLEMIAMKISRILTGNHMEPDHWLDIQGYAQLALDDIHFQEGTQNAKVV